MSIENSGLTDSRSSRRKARARRNEKNKKIKKYIQRIVAWAIVIAIASLAVQSTNTELKIFMLITSSLYFPLLIAQEKHGIKHRYNALNNAFLCSLKSFL